MKRIEVAVLGSTGYVGEELVGILEDHSEVSKVQTPTRDELPEFEGSEVVFSALPHGHSAQEVARYREKGSTVIDLSGDLRFPTPEQYEEWYDLHHPAPHLLPTPYGLLELNRKELSKGRKIVSMPGCYPTATLLGLMPLIDKGLIDENEMIIVDADSGISGRGKKPTEDTHFMAVDGNAVPYKTGRQHRHVGEMELFLGGREVFFSPMTISIGRGMLVKATAKLAFGKTPGAVREALEETYESEPFVKVLPEEELPDIHQTARTDQCHIGFVAVKHTLQIGSSIDNLRKGAASQAIQAFNIIHGLPEETGLKPKAGWRATATQ